MKKIVWAATAAVALVSTAASASWDIDAEGYGFVGKGDVQNALGWNNHELQANAGSLQFTYIDQATYAVPCRKEVGSGSINYNTFSRSRGIDSSVEYASRKNSQQDVTGFHLGGFIDEGEVGENVQCPGGWEADGEPYLVSSAGGGLYVNGVLLPAL